MQEANNTVRAAKGSKRVVSGTDAVAMMVVAAVAAVATTIATVAGIIADLGGSATLTLPLATDNQRPSGLRLGAEAHFTSIEAVIPSLPPTEAALLAWAHALNHVGLLAVLALVFLLAFRLRDENLFTAGSVWVIGACGAVLAVAGTIGQVLEQAALARLAEAIGANKRAEEESIIFEGTFNFSPLLAGTVLLLVAAVFQFGGRLQKDTEGLV